MDENQQELALGRANAAVSAMMALCDYFQEDLRMGVLMYAHAQSGRTMLLDTLTPDGALDEYNRTMDEFLSRLPKMPKGL